MAWMIRKSFLRYGDECPHPLHAPAGESCIIVIHDPVLSDHLDSRIEQDFLRRLLPLLEILLCPFLFPELISSEVKPRELHDLRLGAEL